MSRIINFGSINLDHVYQVPHFVRPGETLSGSSYGVGFGGKGFNQSIALARAGAHVLHAGAVGADGAALLERLQQESVDVTRVMTVDGATGHAVIQVSPDGQNAIVLFAGANAKVGAGDFPSLFEGIAPGDHFLCQNETSGVQEALSKARELGLTVWFNPAPMKSEVLDFPFEAVDWLIVNETEGEGLTGVASPTGILKKLKEKWPRLNVVLTLGADGVIVSSGNEQLQVPAVRVAAVDTTAAGDTFIGYFVAGIMAGTPLGAATDRAVRAAAISVTRPGAADSVPYPREL